MGLDIGLSPIDRKVVAKLLGANVLVIVVVLIVFCVAVYGFSVGAAQAHLREKLIVFAGSIVGSIDSGETEPDLIRSPTADMRPVSLSEMNLQWFSLEGKLLRERGDLPVTYPFDPSSDFQTQNKPHALLFTRTAVVNGRLLGYVRIAQSLSGLDGESETLRWGLLMGVLTALIISAGGILWLIKLTLKPIEESFLRLKQFTDDASHELRNPIMAIRSNCSLVIRHAKQLEPEHHDRLVMAVDATDQMMRLADDLLVLAQADRNFAGALLECVDLSALVDDVVKESRSRAQEKNILLKANIAAGATIKGDREQLRRVFGNLVDNAILYTGNEGQITVELQFGQNALLFKVSDTGIGIAPTDLPKIFDRFWRGDRARSYRTGGTGLGLAIAKSIVENHKGSINVASSPGKGSSFVVTLPRNGTQDEVVV